MLDLAAWGEFVVILILALIIIGPKDMPKILRVCGRWIGKMRDFSYTIHNTLTTLSHQEDEDEEKGPKSHP